MKVTCSECGVEAEVAHPVDDGDPEQDGFTYELERREDILDVEVPTGETVQTPVSYLAKVARSFKWLCPNGHLNEETEELEEAGK